jgi:hypothetical protein
LRRWFERRFSFEHLSPDDFRSWSSGCGRAGPRRAQDLGLARASHAAKRRGLVDPGARRPPRRSRGATTRGSTIIARRERPARGRPAERKTYEARHNEREVAELVLAFRRERGRFVERLDAWERETLAASAIHPRLQQPMRLVDMLYFVAEHDDHHLARMTELLRASGHSELRTKLRKRLASGMSFTV